MKQIYPSSITAGGFAEGGSVLDHAFGKGDPYTLGVEEEYMLLDGETFDLVQHIDTFLATVVGHELEPQMKAELMQSVLEIATPVCRNAGDVDRELRKLREYVASVAQGHSLRVGSSGTHPFSLFERQRITARDRYRALVDQLQYIARRELIFGLHVHVAVDDPEKAIQVVNGLLTGAAAPARAVGELAVLARGADRARPRRGSSVFAAFPRSGPPPRFKDYADYAEVVGQLEKTGCIADYTHIWWDIRPAPAARDGRDPGLRRRHAGRARGRPGRLLPGAREACTASGSTAARRSARFHRILTNENKWLAARYGLEAPLMDLETGRRNRAPVAQLVRRRLKELVPHARELGLGERARGDPGHPRARERGRPPAARLQREPRPRRGRPRDRRRDRGRRGRYCLAPVAASKT